MNNTPTYYKWAFLTLLMVNIGILAAFFIANKKHQKEIEFTKQIEQRTAGWGQYYRDMLGLSKEQHYQFRDLRQAYHTKAHKIAHDMDKVREEILDELGKKNTNTKKLDKLSEKIGQQHTELKKVTSNYYLDMKNICTPEQQIKLNAIFRLMTEGEFMSHPKEGGGMHHEQVEKDHRANTGSHQEHEDTFREFEKKPVK